MTVTFTAIILDSYSKCRPPFTTLADQVRLKNDKQLQFGISSGITFGRVLNEELYAQRFQKLMYLQLFTDCFMKISSQLSEQIQLTDFYKGNLE